MKLARLIQINAMEAALLSAVPPKALPRPSRVPLPFFALDNSQDHQTRLAFSALTPEPIQTSVTRLGGSVANACSGMRMSASDRRKPNQAWSRAMAASFRRGERTEVVQWHAGADRARRPTRRGSHSEVEQHFLEQYSHSSAPEVFLGAVSQRPKDIRPGPRHMSSSPNHNHPACPRADGDTRSGLRWLPRVGVDKSAPLIEMHDFSIEPG